MKRKIVGSIVVTLLIATAVLPATGMIKEYNKDENEKNRGCFDNLDQSQTTADYWGILQDDSLGKQSYLQSFRPYLPILTKVSIYVWRVYNPQVNKIQVIIKSELESGHWMTHKDLTLSDFPEGKNWITVDLDDILVEPDRTYYLCVKPVGVSWNEFDFLAWGYAASFDGSDYEKGKGYKNSGEGWEEFYEIDAQTDFAFKTYGESNHVPYSPTCSYIAETDELKVEAIDPDGHQVKYGVSWNNNEHVDTWTEFVDSGSEKRIACEGRTGTVGVIAEDELHAQSGWVSVTSKNKVINFPFLQFLENIVQNHPHLFPLLRQLLLYLD